VANVLSCFFPTTVVLVDDDPVFLALMEESLQVKGLIFRKFTNPLEALSFINETSTVNYLDCSDLFHSNDEENMSDWKSVMFNVNKVHQKIYDPNRFAQISTAVIDYSMGEEMNGIELCKSIVDQNIQKILLTGATDEKTAVEAFNSGYISRFIKKGEENCVKDVANSIRKSARHYFNSYTDDIFKYLSVYRKNHLKDPVFAGFFSSVCANRSYEEYYMLDSLGSYLFLNPNGQASFLSVLTEDEMEKIVAVGVESGEIAPDVYEILRSREYMLVSHSRTGELPPVSEWAKYVQPAHKLKGYQTYYFSLTDSQYLDLDFKNVKSFELFKKTKKF
jgi:CheY-like chemotaxis protein